MKRHAFSIRIDSFCQEESVLDWSLHVTDTSVTPCLGARIPLYGQRCMLTTWQDQYQGLHHLTCQTSILLLSETSYCSWIRYYHMLDELNEIIPRRRKNEPYFQRKQFQALNRRSNFDDIHLKAAAGTAQHLCQMRLRILSLLN